MLSIFQINSNSFPILQVYKIHKKYVRMTNSVDSNQTAIWSSPITGSQVCTFVNITIVKKADCFNICEQPQICFDFKKLFCNQLF